MKRLTESDIINVFREEWQKRVKRITEEAEKIGIQVTTKVPGDGVKSIISPGLKVKHKKSGLRYTIVSVDLQNGDVVLRKPDGEPAECEPVHDSASMSLKKRSSTSFPEDGDEHMGDGAIKISAEELENDYILS